MLSTASTKILVNISTESLDYELDMINFSDREEKEIEGYNREAEKYSDERFRENRKMRMKYILQLLSGNTFKPV